MRLEMALAVVRIKGIKIDSLGYTKNSKEAMLANGLMAPDRSL